MVGPPVRPLPDLAIVGVTALLPMVVGARLVRTPGAASAICGVYLLPASTVSLIVPSVPPPPLLLVSSIVFDVVLWLEPSHLASLVELLPGRKAQPRARSAEWQPGTGRAAMAGAAFGLVLAAVEPPFRLFLGGDAGVWSGANVVPALGATAVACAGVATLFSARGRAT